MTKLTIIGAGSAVFTKNIFTDLMFIDDFKKMDIALVDIDEKRLKTSKKRPLLNNKIDLVKTESIADLVNSETEMQRKQAISHLSGFFFT